jgi:phospholipase/carboxylesterase
MHTIKVAWGGLTSYVVDNLPAGESPKLALVLCHGYGAPATDLASLAQPLLAVPELAASTVCIFPGAGLDLAERGMPGGRAWWHLDLDRLLNRPSPELLLQFRQACPDGLAEARASLLALLGEAGKQLGLTADRFVLGGFSQGSMLATDVALRLKKQPAGLAILSGALINEHEWRPLASERGPLNVFQSHGHHDSILPLFMATALRDLLAESGAAVDFQPFDGDHAIPEEVVGRLGAFMVSLAGRV